MAKFNGDQGCAILPRGETDIHFKPVAVPRNLPDAATQPWPIGDANADRRLRRTPASTAALDWGFKQTEHNTRAIVVVHHGKIVGERYAPGWTKDTPQISWSAGKSITAALVGIIVQRGQLKVDDVAPIKEWQRQGRSAPRDSRARSAAYEQRPRLREPRAERSGLVHAKTTSTCGSTSTASTCSSTPSTSRRRSRRTRSIAIATAIRSRSAASSRKPSKRKGENYLTFPQRALFDKIGARNFVLETDAWGNFIMTGFDYGAARDWARFGLLHLWDGMWQGERILPDDWLEFISTPAPADKNQGYGGLWWLNRGGQWKGVPEDAIRASGHMGQYTMVIPSRDAVIVRLGPSPRGADGYFTEHRDARAGALPQ